MTSPFETIGAALAATRKRTGGDATIVLRKGVYYGEQALNITAADSGLTIQNCKHTRDPYTARSVERLTDCLCFQTTERRPGCPARRSSRPSGQPAAPTTRASARRASMRSPFGRPTSQGRVRRCCLLCTHMPAIDRSLSDCRCQAHRGPPHRSSARRPRPLPERLHTLH